MRAKPSLALASVLVSALAVFTAPADAACKKFAFLVNDYGKEGPTKDAQALLDKNIAEWAAQNGVKEYQTGKKTVSCELFLDFVVFDEHTCTAQATVCWGPGVKPNNKGQQAGPAEESTGDQQHPPAPLRKAEALGAAHAQQAAASAPAATEAAPAAPAAEEGIPKPSVEQAAAPAETPAAPPAANVAPPSAASVETGALQSGQGMSGLSAAGNDKPAVSEKDRAAAAAAAASAAAAAERAATAAETAANAAKEAAAAAVAASAASKGAANAKVPPLDHASGAKPAHNE